MWTDRQTDIATYRATIATKNVNTFAFTLKANPRVLGSCDKSKSASKASINNDWLDLNQLVMTLLKLVWLNLTGYDSDKFVGSYAFTVWAVHCG